jgi:hypothetical protein
MDNLAKFFEHFTRYLQVIRKVLKPGENDVTDFGRLAE